MHKNKDFILAAILALVISFALFGNGVGGDFVFDDNIVVVGNPLIGDSSKFFEIFTTPYFAYQSRPGLYRPLTIASYSINDFVFGHSPVSFHVVNILFHALTSFLIFVLFNRLGGNVVPIGEADRGSSIRIRRIGTFAGFIFFMFLPIHVEAVTSIVGRAEILSLLFVVGAILFSLKQKYILASGAFFLGLLSKEMAVAFIPIFLFLEFYRSRFYFQQSWNNKIEDPRFANPDSSRGANRDIKLAFKPLLFFIPSIILYAILRYVALGQYFLQNDATAVYNPIKFTHLLSGVWTSFKVFYLYLEKTFFPISLSSDYSFNQIPLIENPLASFEAVLGVVIFGLFILLFFKTKDFLLRFGIIIFLASYFVISNWVFKTGTIMAERLMYMPSLGLALLVGSFFNYLTSKIANRKFLYGLALIILLFYGFIVIDRNKDWLNNKNLYESAYTTAPKSVVNQTNKAYLEFIAGNYNETEKRLNEVLNIAPEHVPALNLAGQNYKKLGQYQKAEESWKKAIALRNDFLRAYLSLGILYYENGYFQSAEKVLTEAVDIYPRWSEVLFLSLTKVSLEKPDEAIDIIEKHFGDDPLQKQLKFALGWAYLNKDERKKAYIYFNEIKDPKVNIEDFVKTFEGSKVILLGDF
ncbi:MAG: tetratricopeptide repeat protein [bacterium]|nr:tetratricopeptide repeat protein [bacterium]